MDNLIRQMKEDKIVAIIRGIRIDKIIDTAKALYEGGIHFMEITFDQGSSTGIEDTCEEIRMVKETLPEAHVGAGTVMTVEQVQAAYDAGAEFIITPNVNESVIQKATALGMVSMPGAVTPTEIAYAYSKGATLVKVFPVTSLGPEYIKAVRGPLAHIPLVAVGGVDLYNMKDYYQAGVCGFGIGGCLVNKTMIEAGRFDQLKNLAVSYIKTAKQL